MSSTQPPNPLKRPHPPEPHSKPQKRASHDHKPDKSTTTPPTPLNPLKRRIRSLTRLLSSPASTNLPATTRQEHERELSSLKSELEEAEKQAEKKEEEKRRSRIVGRYHKVRFFERRKAERRLKQLRRGFEEPAVEGVGADGETDGLDGTSVGETEGGGCNRVHRKLSPRDKRQMLYEKEVDVHYALYYPLDEPYLSLFAAEGDDQAGSDEEHSEAYEDTGTRKRPRMWYLVEEAMEQGQQALQDLREGRWADRYKDDTATNGQKQLVMTKRPKSVKAKSKPALQLLAREMNGQKAYEARQKKPRPKSGLSNSTKRAASEPVDNIADERRDVPASTEVEPVATASNRRERRKLEREQAAKRKAHEDAKRKAERSAAGEMDVDEDETGVGFFE